MVKITVIDGKISFKKIVIFNIHCRKFYYISFLVRLCYFKLVNFTIELVIFTIEFFSVYEHGFSCGELQLCPKDTF